MLWPWLPRPAAVFAAYDIRARHVLEAARAAGLAVPADVAVIGVDDDPLLCETASPAITSIAMDTEDAGYRAAAALELTGDQGEQQGRLKKEADKQGHFSQI